MSDQLTIEDIMTAQQMLADTAMSGVNGDYWLPVPWRGFQFIDAAQEAQRRMGSLRSCPRATWIIFYRHVRMELASRWRRMICSGEVGTIYGTRVLHSE